LKLEIRPHDLVEAIRKKKKLKIEPSDIGLYNMYGNPCIDIRVGEIEEKEGKRRQKDMPTDVNERIDMLSRALPEIVIRGHPEAQRAVITADDKDSGKYRVLVEGYGLRACMNTEGVDGTRTRTNSVMETREVLGIEAARKIIIEEISQVMRTMDIDPRHMQLLADVMTYKGEVLGITRFGLAKMRDSVLQLASFEKTPDHLFEAAWHMKRDEIKGVSECIIMGQEMGVGTGACQVIRDLAFEEGDIGRKPTIFEDTLAELRGANGKA
jgi:DNA-directed RNA polymerase III subunit RPC1